MKLDPPKIHRFRQLFKHSELDPTRSRQNLVQILQDSVRSHCYPTKYKSYLNGSGQISAQVTKSKPTNTTRHLTRLELADLTSVPSQFWITSLSTRSFPFESRMAQTRPMNSPRCIYLQE